MVSNLDNNYGTASASSTTMRNNNIYLPNKPIITMPYTIEKDQVLSAGSVLGKATATGELRLFNTANSDGSETAFAILLHDVDTTGSNTSTAVAVEGHFDETRLIYGGTSTANDARDNLAARNIYLETPQQIS